MNPFFDAIRFLTVIPAPGGDKSPPEKLGRSIIFFPVVGLLIGLVLNGLNWALSKFLPVSLTSALLVASLALITGGLHLDGLTDTCDGVFVRRSPEERLRIMDDSRVGAFGVIGGVIMIVVKYAAVSILPAPVIPEALIVALVISRFLMVWAIVAFPCARPEGLGWLFKKGTGFFSFVMTAIVSLAIIFWVSGLIALAIAAATWIIISLVALFFKSRLGGLTGDTYGAINELSETLVFIIFVALSGMNLLV